VTLIPVLPSSTRPGFTSFFFWLAELESLTPTEEKQIPRIPTAEVFKNSFLDSGLSFFAKLLTSSQLKENVINFSSFAPYFWQ
jgi:hypothetical protein